MTGAALEPVEPTALDVMYGLVLEDGREWGEAAEPFQIADVEAIFNPHGPLWHYLTRPRGASKTSDTAGVVLAWLVAEAQPLFRGVVVAASETQAGELIEAATGFVERTPGLADEVVVESLKITSKYGGAYVEVLTASESGSWGKGRATGFIVLDEFAQWPETRRCRRVWLSMLSATHKTPGLRLILLTTAPERSHFSYGVLEEARSGPTSDGWHVAEVPGPVPWADPKVLAAQRPHMTESEYQRLVLNQVTDAEDVVVTREDLDSACRRAATLPPKAGRRYLITADIGVKVDPTVIVVSHVEKIEGQPRAKRVVVDHLRRYVPRKNRQVRLQMVEDDLYDLSVHYNNAPIHGDPSQFHQMRQNLELRGRRVKEFKFTPSSVGELGSSLVLSLRNGQLEVPDTPELRDELLHVRLRENSPGVYRLDHDHNRHDDQAVTIGMAVHLHLGKRAGAAGFMEHMRRQVEERKTEDARADAEATRAVRRFQRHLSQRNELRRGMAEGRRRRCEHMWRHTPPHDCMHGCGATVDSEASRAVS
jgi:hypothetical protein